MASLVYLVLYLYLHACSARPLTVARVSDKGVKTLIHGSNLVDISYSWKTSPPKMLKRVERTMQESAAPCNCNNEENVSSEDDGKVEDVVVMDYAQPHRKPPIHNKGT